MVYWDATKTTLLYLRANQSFEFILEFVLEEDWNEAEEGKENEQADRLEIKDMVSDKGMKNELLIFDLKLFWVKSLNLNFLVLT